MRALYVLPRDSRQDELYGSLADAKFLCHPVRRCTILCASSEYLPYVTIGEYRAPVALAARKSLRVAPSRMSVATWQVAGIAMLGWVPVPTRQTAFPPGISGIVGIRAEKQVAWIAA
jgi:hypothetical protein